MDLTVLIYEVTNGFPVHEKYGLVTQMRRAAISVPSNLSEGVARTSEKELLQFLSIARGSLSELDTQLEICCKLGYLTETQKARIDEVMTDVDRLLYGLMKSVRNKPL